MEEEEKQLKEYLDEKYQSFEETARGIPRIEAAGREIDSLEPTVGGNSHETNTDTHFFTNQVTQRRDMY